MLKLNKLEPVTKKRKRIGRGGSRGGQSGRGHKGQRSRSGGQTEIKAFFEGGQMPLSRRLPRRGFNNRFKKDFRVINLSDLELRFNDGETIDRQSFFDKGLIKGNSKFFVKILGSGKLTKKLVIKADAFSKSAIVSIEGVGGTVQFDREINCGTAS
jgi:large subunit ribosomal protein L15